MAQAVHALAHFSDEHFHEFDNWLHHSNFLVIVAVPDQGALLTLAQDAMGRSIKHFLVREPDLDNEATALALDPGAAASRLCSSLPLALKPDKTLRSRVRKAVTSHIGNTFGSGDEVADDIYSEVIGS